MAMVKAKLIKRYEVYLVNLEPTVGYEIKKTRPCVIVSPDEMKVLKTVIIAPMTTVIRDFPFRVHIYFEEKEGQVALDQIRCVDKIRLIKKLGAIDNHPANEISRVLIQMFSQ